MARISEQVAVNTEAINRIDKRLDRFENNHFVHFQEGIDGNRAEIQKVRLQIAYWVGGTSAILAALQLFLKFL